MLKWALMLLGVLLLAGTFVWLVGTRLPVEHEATVERPFRSAPEAVWRALVTPESYPTWRSGLRSVERLPDRDGHPVWRERSGDGDLTFEVVESEPPARLVTRIADEGLPFGGTWTWRLDPRDGGTDVTVRENGEVYNPLFRFMSRYVFGHDATMRRFLDDLERHLEPERGAG